MRYRVLVKKWNAYESWMPIGTYQSEGMALSAADRASARYTFVRVVDQDGRVVWSG